MGDNHCAMGAEAALPDFMSPSKNSNPGTNCVNGGGDCVAMMLGLIMPIQ